jgi:hypothetical protein
MGGDVAEVEALLEPLRSLVLPEAGGDRPT